MGKTAGANGAFAAATVLFFGWGYITSLVDPLIAAMKNIFTLTNVEAQLSAFAFFIAYGIVSLPAAIAVNRLGAVRGVIAALAVMIIGCLVILFASGSASYAGVLIGLFVVASGIATLQVSANPLAAALGPPESAHLRLTLSQAFNSLGTVLGPLVGAGLFLDGLGSHPIAHIDSAAAKQALRSIDNAFFTIVLGLIILATIIWTTRRRIEMVAPTKSDDSSVSFAVRQAFASPWALLGGAGIFFYVGAEVSIGAQLALFLHDPTVWNVSLQHAGFYVSLYWLGAMVGRFAGSALMLRIPAARLLAVVTASAALLCLIIFAFGGQLGGYIALAIGLCNSIMFPTIFTLTMERSTASHEITSGFLCTAIIGGAFLPLLSGAISDAAGYGSSFAVPMACYACLCGFALLAGRTPPRHTPPTYGTH